MFNIETINKDCDELFSIFVNDDDYESVFETFLVKIKTHFDSTTDTLANTFLNSFESLLRQHIKKETTEANKKKFTEEIIKKYWVFALQRTTEFIFIMIIIKIKLILLNLYF